jgi:hypothetical protein
MPAVRISVVTLFMMTACAPKMMPPVDGSVTDEDAGVDAGAVDAGPTCGCERWSAARDAGQLSDPLVELSGLVASRSQPGIFYAHNDSGDSARFFAVSQTGQVLQTFVLDGATATDWEDIALGPCPTGTCLYIGDIGDNLRVRTNYAVYRVPEPTVTSGTTNVTWERLRFEYPGAVKHNCESLLMQPKTGVLYLVTKEDTAVSEVYRFPPPSPDFPVTLDYVAALTIPGATDRPLTAADVNPCGTAVLMRMYNRLVEYRLPAGETNFERIFSVPPVNVPFANEAQGEAVAYSFDGMSYFTASEKLVDTPSLFEFRCR